MFQTSGPQIDPGNPVTEPATAQDRFFFWIDENDNTPDIRFDVKNSDGSAINLNNTTVEWYLRFKFKAGNFDWITNRRNVRNPGTVFDIDEWHKLTGDQTNKAEVRLKSVNEDFSATGGFGGADGLGGLGVGDYEIVARLVTTDGVATLVIESNLIRFKILGMNPADGGRSRRIAINPDRMQPQITLPSIPATISAFIDQFPNRTADGIPIPLKEWYKAVLKEESVWGGTIDRPDWGYPYMQDWDCFQRTPELPGDVPLHVTYRQRNEDDVVIATGFDVRFGFSSLHADNGWGASQQTHSRPNDPIRHISRWKNNISVGWNELSGNLSRATNDVKRLHNSSSLADILANRGVNQDQLVHEILFQCIKKYNGGPRATEYRSTPQGPLNPVVPQHTDYVRNVIEKASELGLQ